MPEMTGAQAIFETIKAEGVKHVFCVPGSTEIPLLEALTTSPEIEFIGSVHESVAMAMADGYARATRKPGITLVHATPGTCYTLANLYNAERIGVPLILMAGESDSHIIVNEPLLSSDLVGMTRNFTKWSWRIGNAGEIPKVMRRAFKVASTPPVGAVFLHVPQDYQAQKINADIYPPDNYHVSMKVRPDPDQVKRAVDLLAKAERPIIIAGNRVGLSGSMSELVDLAETLGARVYGDLLPHSLNFPMNHPLFVGTLGFTEIADVGRSADVILAVGCNIFEDVFYPEAAFDKNRGKLIHLDSDPWEIAKNHPLDVALMTDIAVGLREVTSDLKKRVDKGAVGARSAKVREHTDAIRAKYKKEFEKDADVSPLRVWRMFTELKESLPTDCILVDKAMGYRNYEAKIFDVSRPDSYHSTSGALAWAMGAALGVQLAHPDKRVISLGGDGETMFDIQALWTASTYNIPVVNVVVNNRAYMSVKCRLPSYGAQAAKRGLLPGVDLENMDFVKIAEGFGVRGWKVEKPGQLNQAMKEALALNKPALIDVIVDPKDAGYGFPRIP